MVFYFTATSNKSTLEQIIKAKKSMVLMKLCFNLSHYSYNQFYKSTNKRKQCVEESIPVTSIMPTF